MVEQLGSRDRIYHHRSYSLSRLVDFDTLLDAGFNAEGDSSLMYATPKGTVDVYLGHVNSGRDLNIVVIGQTWEGKDGNHTRWYLGTFPGQPLERAATPEDEEVFFTQMRATLRRPNRVPGAELRERIQAVVDQSQTRVLSSPLSR